MLIEIEPESLTRVCDAALGYARMNALIDVNKIMFALTKAQEKERAISNFETAEKGTEKKDGSTISPDNSKLAN